MAIPVMMPRQGQSVESCIISQWFRNKGDSVKAGDPLFSYETDKASFEEEAKADGILLEIFYGEGDEAPVLSNVAVIGRAGESVDEFRPGGSVARQAEAQTPSTADTVTALTETVTAAVSTGAKIRISPRARAIAGKKGVDPATVKGTGPNGRIIARDVEGLAAAAPTPNVAAAPAQAVKPAAPENATVAAYGDDVCEVKKLTNIRKLIAKAMYESLQNSAQLTHHMSADVRKLLALREEVKKAHKADPNYPNITLNDMVCWAVVRALEKFPEANSQFLGDSIKTFKQVHLGLAVDTPRGLMVPVLRNADDLSLKGLSNKLRALADACRKGGIDPELLQSAAGSFTVSNLGNYGVEMFTPIINVPQVAILGVNAIIQRPADIGGGVMAFVPYIGLSLTYDHRAVDGGPATLFLREIKTQIENFNANV
jgi:pyruvate dehydrogenase E2 component (dihydrolipoamide acetyltransferase)